MAWEVIDKKGGPNTGGWTLKLIGDEGDDPHRLPALAGGCTSSRTFSPNNSEHLVVQFGQTTGVRQEKATKKS